MMKRKTAVIFGIIIAAQLCLTPYAGVKVQAAELEEGQMFEDSSEDSETFGDVSIPDTQSVEKTEENEFGDDDGFSDGDVETFSAEDADQFRENMQELVLNVQDGEDITVKLNTLLAQARDKATDEKAVQSYRAARKLYTYGNFAYVQQYLSICRGCHDNKDFTAKRNPAPSWRYTEICRRIRGIP